MEKRYVDLDIDASKLTTKERRKFLYRMQQYKKYFQQMQQRAEQRSVIDRIKDSIESENTKLHQKKAEERLMKYAEFMSNVYKKTQQNSSKEMKYEEICCIKEIGMGFSNGTLSGTLLGGSVSSFLNNVSGLSDKQQAVYYKKMCETLMGVMQEFNVPEEAVKQELTKTMKKINEIKEKYKDVADEDDMAKLIQDECVIDLTSGVRETQDCIEYKKKMITVIGESAWNKMNVNSQIFIVTGELLFEQWNIYGENGIDFSPICLSVSKGLEVEITRRYFLGFRDYLLRNGLSLPDIMYTNNGTVKEDDKFMLGDLTSVTGYVVYTDTQNVKLLNRLIDTNQKFIHYAKTDLFKGKSEAQCVEIIKKHLLDVKNICQKYRNPAAHKQIMDKMNARECLDYMIDVKRVLGKIIDDCDW